MDDYLQHEKPRRREGSTDVDLLEEVIAGLKEYFEKCLGRILLYRYFPFISKACKHLTKITDLNAYNTKRFMRRGVHQITISMESLPVILTVLNTYAVFLVGALILL